MYFPDNVAGLMALSERVQRFVLRWAQRHRAPAPQTGRRVAETLPQRSVSALRERGECVDHGVPR
jgi:hypothetical protein